MRWDIRRPELAFGDRFVLVAGHCNPAIYAMLAVYNEAMRLRYEQTGDDRFLIPNADDRELSFDDLNRLILLRQYALIVNQLDIHFCI